MIQELRLQQRTSQRGFTLMETLIVVALFAVLMLVLYSLFDRHGFLYNYEQAQLAVTSGARSSFNDLNEYLIQGHRVVTSQAVNGTTYTTDSATVVLQFPGIDSSGAVLSNVWDYAVFTLSGNRLTEVIQAGTGSVRKNTSRLLTDKIASLTFTYDNSDLSLVHKITVDLQIAQTVRNQTVTNNAKQDFYLRNY